MSFTAWGRVVLTAGLSSLASVAHAEIKAPSPAANPAPSVAPAPTPPDKTGVVLVEQAGRVAALGVVLNGDGRVVTSLSRIAPGQVFVRYASGAVENARIGHSDTSRDLALLVPKRAREQKGLKAAEGPLPQGSAKVVGYTLLPNRSLGSAPQTLQGAAEVNGHAVIKLSTPPKPHELGGPLLDERGDAAAIVVSGCAAGSSGCTSEPVALPVSEVRAFLRSRPPSSGFQLPRLGIAGRAADTGVVRGLLISSVDAKTPAAALGLRASEDPAAADVLVAVNGAPVVTEDALRSVLARHVAGDRVELLVFGNEAYRSLATRLGAPVQAAPAAAVVPSAPASKATPPNTVKPQTAPIPPSAPLTPPPPATHSK